jgi:hypothetical protein
VSDKRIPKPGEVWALPNTDTTVTIVNVYDDCLTYDMDGALGARTIPSFLLLYNPPEPTVVRIEEVWFRSHAAFFYASSPNKTHLPEAIKVGTIAAMSDGTFRFEAAS